MLKSYILKTLWGMEYLSLEEKFEWIAAAGYDGIEARMPSTEDEATFKRLVKAYDFACVIQIGRDGGTIESFKVHVERAAGFHPLLINSHSSKHDVSYEEQAAFFAKALDIERKVGFPIGHETHRGRAMFTPWNTARLLQDFPNLTITADFSHWCCVCESLLDDQASRLALACERAVHIHARVGYEEGPQVPHPAAPEYEYALQKHLAWWQDIYHHRKKQGAPFFTCSVELGLPPYQQALPFTKAPVADVWESSQWLASRIRQTIQSLED